MRKKKEGLYYPALFLAGWVFFLLIAGGAVTSHEAGLAVPDWPLSYGQFFPPMVGNIFWEHGHRMIAGIAAILTLALAVLVQLREDRVFLKKLAWAAVGVVIVQALLGGLTVLLLLPPAVSIAHACLGQTFFCLVLALAYYLNPDLRRTSRDEAVDPKIRRFLAMTTGFIYLQLILGAMSRHTAHISIVITHIAFAFVVIAHIVLSLIKIHKVKKDDKNFKVPSITWAVLAVFQVFLGIGSFVTTRMIERGTVPGKAEVIFTVAHQSLGALLLGLGVILTLMFFPIPRSTQARL